MCSLHLSDFFAFLDSHPVPAAPTTHMQVVFPCLPWFDLTCHAAETLLSLVLIVGAVDAEAERERERKLQSACRLPLAATGLALVCTKVKPGAEVAETNDQAVTAVWASKRALPAIG